MTILVVALCVICGMHVNVKAAPLKMPDGTVFDPIYYADSYGDLKKSFGYNEQLLWSHYVNFGRKEGRSCANTDKAVGTITFMKNNTFFDAAFYASKNPDVVKVFGKGIKGLYDHYVKYGQKEGRQAFEGQVVAQSLQVKDNSKKTGKTPYYVCINKAACTVTVYSKDANGYYTVPCKAMVCSTGDNTPVGTFKMGAGARWLLLVGDTMGQYAKHITGHIWFHSVMYTKRSADTLLWEEYNKLGTVCSHGCVRLTAEDAKWIYDNCVKGTLIEIYNDAEHPGPLGKPEVKYIDGNDSRRGWDPTDPDSANPWKQ